MLSRNHVRERAQKSTQRAPHGVCTKEKPGVCSQHFFLHTYAAHFSYLLHFARALLSSSLPLSLRILASVVAKRHTFPKEQTTRPTDRARTHTHSLSLSNSLSFSFVRSRSAPRNKKTRHLFGFLMVFLRSRTTINYDLFLINSNSLPVKYNHYNYVCVFCFFFATVFLNFCLFCFVFAENYACQA